MSGGQSKRMGRSKATLPFGPQTMLERIVELVRPAVDQVLIVAGLGQDLPEIPAVAQLVHDELYDRGPLGGLATALNVVGRDTDAIFLTACDSPFLRPALATRLFELLGEHSLSIPSTGDRLHPLTAVYRTSILPVVRSQLAQDKLRMIDLVPLLPTRRVTRAELAEADREMQSLRNVNTPEEYESALRDAGF